MTDKRYIVFQPPHPKYRFVACLTSEQKEDITDKIGKCCLAIGHQLPLETKFGLL